MNLDSDASVGVVHIINACQLCTYASIHMEHVRHQTQAETNTCADVSHNGLSADFV
jgi:hypothetical protein